MRVRRNKNRSRLSLQRKSPTIQMGISVHNDVENDDVDSTVSIMESNELNLPFDSQSATLLIDDHEEPPKIDSEFQSPLETLFTEEEFLNKWNEVGKSVHIDVQDVLVKHYAFVDLLGSLEAGLRANIDRNAIIVDSALEKELVALTNFKLIALFARLQFGQEMDYKAILRYLLTPETTTGVLKKGRMDNPSNTIREMYELFKNKVGNNTSPQTPARVKQPESPVGYTSRRKST